jgi:two-component system, OmpR family, alkaline phosphatase synthesis response regulator PhoP
MAREAILVVDDERDIRELLDYNLRKEGYEVTCVSTGEDALASVRARRPDLIVLDLMLPGVDGLEVCRRLQADAGTRAIPIVMLTAKGEEADVVTGLELGAADYVTKPFSPRVLLARVRAVLRREAVALPDAVQPLTVGAIVVHPGRHEVTVDARPADLTASEFRIMHTMARRPGWVFTRRQLVEAVQGDDVFTDERDVAERSVDVHIVSLRRKLGGGAAAIETVRGVGYRLKDA